MIYCKTIKEERIVVHPMNNHRIYRSVDLTMYGDEPFLSVYIEDDKNEWLWEFDMTVPSNYERVKMCIYDVIFECDTMPELAEMLDDVFHEGFASILIEDECDGCEHCNDCPYTH